MNEINKLGIVGLGNMGKAIALGVSKKKTFSVIGFDPALSLPGIENATNLRELEEKASAILLAVKPNQISKVCKELTSGKPVLSIAAGISVATMQSSVATSSPIVRIMPNLPLLVGEGAIAYFCQDSEVSLVESIFGSLGVCVRVADESLLNAVTGLSGSGPAYVFSFLHALAEGGVKAGLNYKQALELSLQTILGSAKYFAELQKENPEIHPMEVRNWVTSPGGTTIFGLDALERENFSTAVRDAVVSATKRSEELGKK